MLNPSTGTVTYQKLCILLLLFYYALKIKQKTISNYFTIRDPGNYNLIIHGIYTWIGWVLRRWKSVVSHGTGVGKIRARGKSIRWKAFSCGQLSRKIFNTDTKELVPFDAAFRIWLWIIAPVYFHFPRNAPPPQTRPYEFRNSQNHHKHSLNIFDINKAW